MTKDVKRLFAGFQPHQYVLALDIDPEAMRFKGKVTIVGQKAGRPTQRLTLHQKDLQITAAQIIKHDKKGDHPIVVTRINTHKSYDEVRLHTDQQLYPGHYTVHLVFSGIISDNMHGIYASSYEHDGQKRKLISTQFESHHAREAFPCIDEPEAKAIFDIALTAPKDQVVIGNMPIKSAKDKGQTRTTTFEPTPKMSPYLAAFALGDLHCKETKTKDGVVVRVWATAAQPAHQLDFALGVAKRSIEFFNQYYGVPYPLSKSDHVAIPDFSNAAMENWGLVTYREPYLLVDPETTSESGRETVAVVINHELSHQWFGNLVTMKWWDDLWLNESFANVMEYVATDALFPEWHIWNHFVANEALSAQRRDALDGVQPVKTTVRHPDEITTLFDPSIVYAKGGRLLNMLMHYLGEEAFRKGLKLYFTKHAYGNTTGDDLWAALQEASGKDVAAFMNPWLTRPGFPLISVTQKTGQLELKQSHFLTDPDKADPDRLWPVPTLSSSSSLPQILSDRSVTVDVPAKQDYVYINEGAHGHYVVDYTEAAHVKAIAKQVADKKRIEAERLILLSDSAMIAKAGLQPFAETLELLTYYAHEDSEPVWDIIALIIADAKRFIDLDETLEKPLKALIRKLIELQYKRLGFTQKAKESIHDIKLRATIIALGVYAEHPAILKQAKELFATYQTDPKAIPAELRSIVFSAAVRHKVAGAFEYLLGLDETTNNVDLKQDIMGALPATKDKQKADLLLERLTNPDKVRKHDIDHWVFYMLRNRDIRDQAWQWLQGKWPWIEQAFGGDKSYDYFPRYAASAFNTHTQLTSYKQFFEPKKSQVILVRNITMGIEEIETRANWLKRDLKTVEAFFKNKHR